MSYDSDQMNPHWSDEYMRAQAEKNGHLIGQAHPVVLFRPKGEPREQVPLSSDEARSDFLPF